MLKIFKYFAWIIPFIFFCVGYLATGFFFKTSELEVPNIVGKHIHEAISQLSVEKLNIRIIKDKEDPSLAPGTVISQDPHSGKKIKSNQTVFVTVSQKPRPLLAPCFIGSEIQRLEQELKTKNIRAKIYHMESDHPKGTCIAQIPEENEPLEGKKITLYVSEGTKKFMLLPDFRNKKMEEISETLKEQNLETKIVHHNSVDDDHQCIDCIVEHQRPLPGSLISPEKPLALQLQVR